MRELLEKLLRSVDAPHPERAEALWAEYRAGGPGADAAFGTLLAWYGGAIYRRIWGFVRSDAADDVFQDVLTKLHRQRHKLATFEHALRWLRIVAVTQSVDAHRRHTRRKARELARGVPAVGATPPAPQFELQEAVRVALASLSDREQQAVALVYFEGLTKQDAAAEMGIHRDTLAKLLDGALAKLRAALPAAAVAGTATLEAALSSAPLLLPARLTKLAAGVWDKAHSTTPALPGAWLPGKAQLLAGIVLSGLVAASLALTTRSPDMPTTSPRTHLGLERLEDRSVPSFGTGGTVITDVDPNGRDIINAMAVQPADGKIVAAGMGGIVRYNPGGSLDASFNPGGPIPGVIRQNYSAFLINAVVIQPDGKIVTAGGSHNGKDWDFLLERFLPNGTPDPTFGTGGVMKTAFKANQHEVINSVVLQADGKIVVAGKIKGEWAVARYLPSGALDKTFNKTGSVTTAFGNTGSNQALTEALAVAVQPDGKIVVAGRAVPAGGNYYTDFAVVRYTTTGGLDTSFGTGGKVTIDFRNSDRADSLALQPDGKILLGGVEGRADRFALARLNPNGSLDAGFGQNGKLELGITDNFDSSSRQLKVAVQPDGKIVGAGGGFGIHYAIRLTPTGGFDTTFNAMGWRVFNYENPTQTEDRCYAVALQSDGKILIGGAGGGGENNNFALSRFNPDGRFDGVQSPPTLGSFTASPNPVPTGGTTTLTVGGVTSPDDGSTVGAISVFYLDATGNERLLGFLAKQADGTWTLSYTVALPPGSYTLFAFAHDDYGRFSDPLALTLTVT